MELGGSIHSIGRTQEHEGFGTNSKKIIDIYFATYLSGSQNLKTSQFLITPTEDH